MTAPAIATLPLEDLRAAVAVLRDLLEATSGLTEAAAVRAMMRREAEIAQTIIDNTEAEEDESALADLADTVAKNLAQAGTSSPGASRVAPSAPASESGHLTWTDARKALLRERYPEGDHEEDLLVALNELPGIAVSSGLAVNRQATKMGLKRLKRAPYRYSAEGLANMRAAADRARVARAAAAGAAPAPDHLPNTTQMVPPPAAPIVPAPADDGNPHLDVGDEQEAREMLAKGKGARDLEHWFGGSLGWWQAWCERERAQMGRAA